MDSRKLKEYQNLVERLFLAIEKLEEEVGHRIEMREVNAIADSDPSGLSLRELEVRDAVIALEIVRRKPISESNTLLLKKYDDIMESVRRSFLGRKAEVERAPTPSFSM
jgi:predicted transcriptional regulator YheO